MVLGLDLMVLDLHLRLSAQDLQQDRHSFARDLLHQALEAPERLLSPVQASAAR